ncbi:MAG: glycosyltransferase family 39 protein [Rhodospirillales bacterium]
MRIASGVAQPAAAPPKRPLWLERVNSWRLASILVLLVLLTLSLATFRDYGVSWDDRVQKEYGEQILAYYASGFADRRAITPNDDADDGNLPYYGGSFDLTSALINKVSQLGTYPTRHLLGAIVGLIGLVAAWRLGERIAGARAGFLALVLLATVPAYYGHMFMNPKDIPFAAAMIVVLLTVCGVLAEWPRPRWRTVLCLGVATGAALGTRVGAVVAAFDLAVPLAVWLVLAQRRAGLRPTIAASATGFTRLLAVLPLTWVVMAVLWPWAAQGPLNPLHALAMFSHFPFSGDELFEGQWIPATEVPRSYLLVFLAITLPESMLLGLLAAFVAAALALASRRYRPISLTRDDLKLLAVGTAALFPLVYFVLARPTAYNGMRHFLFILPPLAVVAAVGADAVWRSSDAARRPLLLVTAAGFLGLAVIRMIAIHPYEYIYFNDLYGGLRAASGQFNLDYWGISLGETTQSLVTTMAANGDGAPSRPWRVGTNGEDTSVAEFAPWFMTVVDDDQIDFAVDLCPCEPPAGARLIAQTERQGVILSQAYDLRAHAVAATEPSVAPAWVPSSATASASSRRQPHAGRDRNHSNKMADLQRLAEKNDRERRGEHRHQIDVKHGPGRTLASDAVISSGQRQHRSDHADVEEARQHRRAGEKVAAQRFLSDQAGREDQQARQHRRQRESERGKPGRAVTQENRVQRPGGRSPGAAPVSA